jgi:hypothetical protein
MIISPGSFPSVSRKEKWELTKLLTPEQKQQKREKGKKLKEERVKKLVKKDKIPKYHPTTAVSHKKLIPIVAQLHGVPERLVNEVINHSFNFVRKWISNPSFSSRITIPELGYFEINKVKVYKLLEKHIRVFRHGKLSPTQRALLEIEFRELWRLKQLMNVYDKRSKVKYNPSKEGKSLRVQVQKKGLEIVKLPDPFKKPTQTKQI